MNDATKEIELLFPSGKPVTLKGKEITIKPFGFGKYPKILKLMKGLKLGDKVGANASDLAKSAGSLEIMELIADNSEAVVELCALATSQAATYFDDVMPDEAVVLVQAIIEVNVDFFVKRLQPKLLTALSGLTESVGGMLSQG